MALIQLKSFRRTKAQCTCTHVQIEVRREKKKQRGKKEITYGLQAKDAESTYSTYFRIEKGDFW